MTMIRPETEMKDSGIAWIGDIPSNWETIPLKKIVVDRAGGAWGNEPYENNSTICMRIADFDFDRGVFQDKSETELTKRSYKEYQIDKLLLQTNDICIEKSGGGEKTPVGRAVLFDKPYDALFANFMDRIRVDNAVSFPKYVEYYLRAMYFLSVTTLYIKQTTGIQNLNVTSLLEKEVITLPSLSEQQAIADYLDETCSKIDEIIAEAKASIDEYKELKQAVIFEAVTKGLNKNATVYKTGNSWVPVLPIGVKLSRFGLHHDIILGKMLCPNPRNEEDTLEPYYCAANVHFDGVTGVLKTMWFNSKEKETYVVHKNDMLIVEGGAGAGGAAIMNEEPPVSTFVQNSIMIVRSHMKDNRYSCYLVQALVKNKYVDVVCNKATIPHFTKEKVSYMPYPVFNRNERNEIANYLDERCKQIDSLIAEKESLINDLEAYKKSLIYEVVTGKRKVV